MKGERKKEREVTTYQTSRNPLTYILRPRRPAPRHSAHNPTILTRVVSHTRPKKHLGLYFVVWRGESGEMPILGFRHEDSRDFLLCQPITTRWHISSFGTKSLSSTLAPRYQSFHSPITLRLFRMWRPSRSIKLWRVRKSHPGIKTRSYRSLKDRRSKLKSQPPINTK